MARRVPQRRSRDPITGIAPEYDIRLLLTPDTNPGTGKLHKGFETHQAAEAEDDQRTQQLRKEADAPDTRPARRRRLLTLINRIHDGDREHGTGTLASAVNMRALRVRTMAILLRDLEAHQDADLRVITIINRQWRIPASDLLRFDPSRVIGLFRTHLNRAGIAPADGFVLGFIHGEYDGRDETIQLHLHAIADGHTAALVSTLSGRWGYLPLPTGARPIRCQTLKDRPRQLSYLLQSFWPSRATYIDSDGVLKRQRMKSRIPGSHHTNILLWLDKHSIGEITFTFGCALKRNQLVF